MLPLIGRRQQKYVKNNVGFYGLLHTTIFIILLCLFGFHKRNKIDENLVKFGLIMIDFSILVLTFYVRHINSSM